MLAAQRALRPAVKSAAASAASVVVSPRRLQRRQRLAGAPRGFAGADNSGGARAPRGFAGADTSGGARTLGAVVRELRREGRLPPPGGSGFRPVEERPAWVSRGFVDIDADLAAGLEEEEEEGDDDEEASEGEEIGDQDDGPRRRGEAAGQQSAADVGVFTTGTTDSAEDRDLRGSIRASSQAEDVSALSEEELRERVRRSIEELIPQDTAETAAASRDLSGLTPAQVFYMENRERLVSRAQQYYLDKQRELQALQEEGVPAEVEDEWRYYHEPVVRPARGHLWSIGEDDDDTHGTEEGWLEKVHDWPRGRLPTPEMLVDLLRSEKARDVNIVDLEACGRRDVGTYAITATGITSQHCRRLGEIASRATQHCKVPHVEAWCYGTRKDEWVVAHCGAIKVHIFTRETRDVYKLELLWEHPEEFFQPGDFPHFLEIYGTATEAYGSGGGHVTSPTGSRSTAYLPPPFRDTLHPAVMKLDYDAAEDAQYVSPSNIVDVGARISREAAGGEPRGREDNAGAGRREEPAAAAATVAEPSQPPPSRHQSSWPLGDEIDTDEEAEEGAPPATRAGRRSRAGAGARGRGRRSGSREEEENEPLGRL